MAYEEYLDLYLAAQEKSDALYYVVSFDVVGSKMLSPEKRKKLQENIYVIVKYVYNKLIIREVDLNRPVLIEDDRFVRPWDTKMGLKYGYFMDPFVYGDCFQFTVLRNTVTKEEIVDLVDNCKNHLKMDEEFHVADGYYETNNYVDSHIKLFRGDCLHILESMHKEEIQQQLNLIKK